MVMTKNSTMYLLFKIKEVVLRKPNTAVASGHPSDLKNSAVVVRKLHEITFNGVVCQTTVWADG